MVGREWNSMPYEGTNTSAWWCYHSTSCPIFILHTANTKLQRSTEVRLSKVQWVCEFDSSTQSWGHTVNRNGSVTLIHPFQSHGPVVRTICQSSTTHLWHGCTDRSLWQGCSDKVALTGCSDKVALTGCSDRFFWQVALTSTSYSSNKHSANFVWPTLTTSSGMNPPTLAVKKRILDKNGPLGRTKPFSASSVGIWGPNL